MSDLLWLKWNKSADGYRIEEFDPRGIDWRRKNPQADPPDYGVQAPKGASASTIHLLEKWGMNLRPQIEPIYNADINDWVSPPPPQPYLIVNPIGKEAVSYFPLNMERSLFQEFADTPQTPECVSRFANRYGLLGQGNRYETVDRWCRQIERMHTAIKVWQKFRDKGLTRFVRTFNNRLKSGNINIYFDEVDQRIPATIFLGETEDPKRPRLRIEPRDLLAAMWLELALAVEGNSNYRRCEVCPTWFEVAPGSGREDKKYCSDACRMRAYRSRKSMTK